MRLRTLVVDDEELPRRRVRQLASEHDALEVIGEAADGAEAMDRITADMPDLVLLDIQMPELDGFQLVGSLDPQRVPAVIFITAYDEWALRAFEVGAFDYLLKPITKERFDAAIWRVRQRLGPGAENVRALAAAVSRSRGYASRLIARRSGRHYLIPLGDVSSIVSDGNYLRVRAAGSDHLVRQTMKEIEQRLDPARFLRLHRSAIVAIDRIKALEAKEHGEYVVTLDDERRFVSSRTYSSRVRDLLRGA
jgi:two-component system, LytTR family, response regulator